MTIAIVALIALAVCLLSFMKKNVMGTIFHVFNRTFYVGTILLIILILVGSIVKLIKDKDISVFYRYWSWFGVAAGFSLYAMGFAFIYRLHLSKKSFWRVPDPKEEAAPTPQESFILKQLPKNLFPGKTSKLENFLMQATLVFGLSAVVFGTASEVLKKNHNSHSLRVIGIVLLCTAVLMFSAVILPAVLKYFRDKKVKKN